MRSISIGWNNKLYQEVVGQYLCTLVPYSVVPNGFVRIEKEQEDPIPIDLHPEVKILSNPNYFSNI